MELTARDRGVLRTLAAARWLTTAQVAALRFPAVGIEMARRRLRLLRQARYVVSVQRSRMELALHTLGNRGKRLLVGDGWKRAITLERFPPGNLEHFLGINDIRVAVERSARRDRAALGFFFASWELQRRGWEYSVVPDAVCNVAQRGRSTTALFEYDRATEPLGYVIRSKFVRYARGLDGFPFSRVITVVDSPERLEHLREYTARHVRDGRFSFLLRHALLNSWSVDELFEAPS